MRQSKSRGTDRDNEKSKEFIQLNWSRWERTASCKTQCGNASKAHLEHRKGLSGWYLVNGGGKQNMKPEGI